MVENLRLLFKDITTVNIDRFGSLRDWIHEANNEAYWNQLVKRLLHPDTNMGTAAVVASTMRSQQKTPPCRRQQ
jgi:hypothetical protein